MPKKAAWKRLLSVWKGLEAFGSDFKRVAGGYNKTEILVHSSRRTRELSPPCEWKKPSKKIVLAFDSF
jgi:hypothetical protein